MSQNKEESYDEMMAKAFRLDAERLERMHRREIAEKNKTPEQRAQEKLADERMSDLDKVVDGLMTMEDFKKKWNE